MIVWINGPFGGGKTQTAHEIQRRLPGSVISDPEVAGFGLNRMIPGYLRGDFQDLPVWRQSVYEVLDSVAHGHDGTVLVPMTVIEPKYFREMVGRLRDGGHDVRHFSLLASREVVLQRLSERVFGHALHVLTGQVPLKRESWAVSKLDLCLERLQDKEFAEHIRTDNITVAQAADHIAASTGLSLVPNTDSVLRGRLRRAVVGIRHIRFG
jgi:hypothetical protein